MLAMFKVIIAGFTGVLAGPSRTMARFGDEKECHSSAIRKSMTERGDDRARQARGWGSRQHPTKRTGCYGVDEN